MKEYEIVAKFFNACAGAARPQTYFEEAELEILEISRDLHNSEFAEKNIPTEYEDKFSQKGKNINYVSMKAWYGISIQAFAFCRKTIERKYSLQDYMVLHS